MNSQLNILAGLQDNSETNRPDSTTLSDPHITISGDKNVIAIGENFTQQVSTDVSNVKEGDLKTLLGYLKGQGVDEENLRELVEAIEADGDVEQDQEFGDRVSRWLGQITNKAVDASFTAIATESIERIGTALRLFYGFAAGG